MQTDTIEAPANTPPRQARFAEIIDPTTLCGITPAIIGCGAIGRQVALALASMGIARMFIYDFDEVEDENLGTQGWDEFAVGELKTVALYDELRGKNEEVSVVQYQNVKDYGIPSEIDCVFACVDSMQARDHIREMVEENGTRLLIDGRMNALTLSVYTRWQDDDPEGLEVYDNSIFPDEEAVEGSCTAKSTYYTSAIAAGLMINQMVQHYRGADWQRAITLTLNSMELFNYGTRNEEDTDSGGESRTDSTGEGEQAAADPVAGTESGEREGLQQDEAQTPD